MTDLAFGCAAIERLEALAALTDDPGRITRLYLSAAHIQAVDLVGGWMRQAGMSAHVDPVGTLVGRYEGGKPGAPALLIGSHIDTVVNAGRYDGTLGVVAGIAAVEALHLPGVRYPFAIEIIAFGDEEGVRFPSTLLGSCAMAGTADPAMLDAADSKGLSVRDALLALNSSAPSLDAAARRPKDCLGYLEVHIEQGPVLEAEGLALGVVTAINGVSRFRLRIAGIAGHAGTVPMVLRNDALAAAAEIVLAVEAEARASDGLVATVAQLQVEPGAVNVIPGTVTFTLDIRAPDDSLRRDATARILESASAIARRRGVRWSSEQFHDAAAVSCDVGMSGLLAASLRRLGHAPRMLPSGAGHDAMVMATLCPIAMLFVRCVGGVSHKPAESVTIEDVDAAIRAVLAFVEDLAHARAAPGDPHK